MTGQGLEALIPPRKNVDPVSAGGSAYVNKSAIPENLPVAEHSLPAIMRSELSPHISSVSEPPRDVRVRKEHNSPEAIFHIEVEKIKSNPYQPRKIFNEEELQELSQSIREYGIIQPLVVSKVVTETDTGTGVEYQLITGERRLMAAKLAGFERVPVIIRQAESKQTKLELALIENIQRSNLTPIESARAYARLQDEFELTQREIAARVGKSREVVANTLRLLSLPAQIQEALASGKINESQARALLAISDPNKQNKMFVQLASGAMSVRAMRAEAKNPSQANPETQYWKKKLEEFFGAPVDITRRGARGKLIVQFYSDDEWQSIIDHLFGKEEVV
ncbi:MAG: ParB/RepB/Spo0J family partition protein [Patescibacteria group bacterium]